MPGKYSLRSRNPQKTVRLPIDIKHTTRNATINNTRTTRSSTRNFTTVRPKNKISEISINNILTSEPTHFTFSSDTERSADSTPVTHPSQGLSTDNLTTGKKIESTLQTIPNEVTTEIRGDLYRGPTAWSEKLSHILAKDTEQLCSLVRSNPESASMFSPLPPTVMSTSYASVSTDLKYGIHIFEGVNYPYKKYPEFLASKIENLLHTGPLSNRECMEVTHTKLTSRNDSPLYPLLAQYVIDHNFGATTNATLTPDQTKTITDYKLNSLDGLYGKRKKPIKALTIPLGSFVTRGYISRCLNNDFSTNLTVMVTTYDQSDPTTVIPASIIVLNNGEEEDAKRGLDNSCQYIDIVANNPNISKYPYVKSSAVPLLLTVIRETTILSSYMPDIERIFTSPTETDVLKSYIYEYLKYCAINGKKPDEVQALTAAAASATSSSSSSSSSTNPVPYISPFKKLTLSAISWQVAEIYSKLGFEISKIDDYISMELRVSTKLKDVLSVNRFGFLFNLLGELSLNTLQDSTTVETLNRMIEARKLAIVRVATKAVTSATKAIERGGKRRKGGKRKTLKIKRRTHRRK